MELQNIGLANRRLQPLGHISAPGICYLFGLCGSTFARDSSESGDSCDSGEVAKEVTPPHPGEAIGAQREPARRGGQSATPLTLSMSPARAAGIAKEVTG